MCKNKIFKLSKIAIVAVIYIIATIAISPLSFGPIQFRFSEILVLLCFYNKNYCYSLILGCGIANLFSPLGIYDVVFGTIATAITVFCIYKTKNLFLSSLWATFFCFIVGLELFLLTQAPFWLTTITIMFGEFIVVSVAGVIIFKSLQKNKKFMEIVDLRLDKIKG